jgi:two-component system, OmpR family, KDP operon response regulator KdpE
MSVGGSDPMYDVERSGSEPSASRVDPLAPELDCPNDEFVVRTSNGSLPLVLVVEDEPPMQRLVCTSITTQGYRAITADNGGDALAQARAHKPDLVLLDLGLPDMDGLVVAARLREGSDAPILIVSSRGQERDKVLALNAGANDFVTKPFVVGELLARMHVWLRPTQRTSDRSTLDVGALRLDFARRLGFVEGRELCFTPPEYELFALLMEHAGKVLTHEHILRKVSGPQCAKETHSLRIHMGQLRRKIERDAVRPRYLVTEPGVGYRLGGCAQGT